MTPPDSRPTQDDPAQPPSPSAGKRIAMVLAICALALAVIGMLAIALRGM